MECTAVCRVCGVKVKCRGGNIFALGDHLVKNHPEIDINHYVVEDSEFANGKSNKPQRKPSNRFSLTSWKNKSSTLIKNKKTGQPRSRSLYKTTVESWSPGSDALTCPKCGNKEQPYIRRQRNKVAYNSLGAFFLLGCWPLCFLPMLMAGGADTVICCRKCGYCFGTYDKKKGKLIPSTNDMKIETPEIC